MEREMQDIPLTPLNQTCFCFLRQVLLADSCLMARFEVQLENQMQKFKGIIQERDTQQLDMFRQGGGEECEMSRQMYEQTSLAMLKIMFEQYEQKEVRTESNWRFSKRQVSLQKIQRYIMIMNQVEQEQVTPIFRVKKMIIT